MTSIYLHNYFIREINLKRPSFNRSPPQLQLNINMIFFGGENPKEKCYPT